MEYDEIYVRKAMITATKTTTTMATVVAAAAMVGAMKIQYVNEKNRP